MIIHIQGICGTFMAGVASLAQALGHEVRGSDANVYPPMSLQLHAQGIRLMQGYRPENLEPRPDLVIVGNVMTRGNPELEALLNSGIPYLSGPEWLYREILSKRRVLAVAGTHGKTTTSSMLAWVLEEAGYHPGFLIGGVPENFGKSAILGEKYFVIEADEYDTAFFDKRSKFIHYCPEVAVLNNIEFDHADIFPNLASILQQFHYFLRTVPGRGRIIANGGDANVTAVLEQGAWTPREIFNSKEGWSYQALNADVSEFQVFYRGNLEAAVAWSLMGEHNACNALAVFAAAVAVDIAPQTTAAALGAFKNVKRRLELRGEVKGAKIYDDFAHHPTAIAKTVAALRGRIGKQRLIAVLEFGSNTMKSGHYTADQLAEAFREADLVIFKTPAFEVSALLERLGEKALVLANVEAIVQHLAGKMTVGDHILVMSNKSFEGIHEKLLKMGGLGS